VTGPGDVPPEILDLLRPVCLGLPETYEEPAWVGTRWRIRKRTFAHVLTVDPDHQMAYARAAAADQPFCVLTFRSPGDEIDGLVSGGHPFFKASWGVDVVGMVLDDDSVNWEEVAELLTESYCVLAPKRLAALVDRPPGQPSPPAAERPAAAAPPPHDAAHDATCPCQKAAHCG
jgi:hypothetical protein